MPWSSSFLQDEASRVARELALHQGQAYSSYGAALQRFGESGIDWAALFKTSADLYCKEAVQTATILFRAEVNVYAWALGMVGTKDHRAHAEQKPAAEPVAQSNRRGHR